MTTPAIKRRDVLRTTGAGALALLSPLAGSARAETDDLITFVPANGEAGFNYPYYLYTPKTTTDGERPLLVQTNNTPTHADDFEKHKQFAEDAVRGGFARAVSDELRVPLLVPVFPRPKSEPVTWRQDIHQLDTETMHIAEGPLERVDRQLLRMVADAKDRLAESPYPVSDRIIMNGFSASGLFANRFTALHPDRVQSVTAGGVNGMPILPISEARGHTLNYQIGIADVESLVGEPFDLERFRAVDQFIYLGENDENDTLPYDDSWSQEQRSIATDVYGEDMQEDRFPYAESVYEEVGAAAEFKIYEGVGHRVTREILGDVVAFHKRSARGLTEDAEGTTRDEPATGTPSTASPQPRTTLATDRRSATETPASADGPGFGIGTAVAGLAGAGYLRSRRELDGGD